MNLFENLQTLKENDKFKTLDEIAEQIENEFDERFKVEFGINELYADMLFSATKDISNEYFFEGYDIKLTIQVPQFTNELKKFIESFANEFGYHIRNVSSSQIDLLVAVDEFII